MPEAMLSRVLNFFEPANPVRATLIIRSITFEHMLVSSLPWTVGIQLRVELELETVFKR